MKKTKFADIIVMAAMLAGGAVAAPAAAEDLVSLKGDVKVERTVTVNGSVKTELVAPNDVVPGDRLRFATDYRNDSGAAVDNFVVTNPLPAAVRLAAADDAFEVSVDGGKSWGRLAVLRVSGTDGAQRAAELADVTRLRWVLPRLAPGASGSLTYFAVVR